MDVDAISSESSTDHETGVKTKRVKLPKMNKRYEKVGFEFFNIVLQSAMRKSRGYSRNSLQRKVIHTQRQDKNKVNLIINPSGKSRNADYWVENLKTAL